MLRLGRHRDRSQLSLNEDPREEQVPSFTPHSAEGEGRRLERPNQPTIQLVGPRNNSASTPSSPSIDDYPDKYYQQHIPAVQQKKKRGTRAFFGIGSSSTKDSASVPQQKLGRSISVRKKEPPVPPPHIQGGSRDAFRNNYSRSDLSIGDHLNEEEHGDTGLDNPLRSPAFPPPLTHEEYVDLYGRSQLQNLSREGSSRHPLDRKGSQQSSWERNVHQATKHSRTESTQPTPSSYHPSPISATSTSSHPFAPKSPLEPLHQSHHENSRPPSSQSLEPPPISQHFRPLDYSSKEGRSPLASTAYIQTSMGPPPSQQPLPNRRSSESTQQSQQSQSREGGNYQPYNQGPQQASTQIHNAPTTGYTTQHANQLAPQAQAYRGTAQTSPMAQQGHREPEGRGSPPPSRSRDDLSTLDVAQLLQRHDELRISPFLINHPFMF